jgi:hypothetical protein
MTDDRELLAKWMIRHGYATGHGDTVESLLAELEWQIGEALEQRSAWNLECTNHIGTMTGERDRWRAMYEQQIIAAENCVSVLRDLLYWYDPERGVIDVETAYGCLECTAGTTPNHLNTGPCAYHRARVLVRRDVS